MKFKAFYLARPGLRAARAQETNNFFNNLSNNNNLSIIISTVIIQLLIIRGSIGITHKYSR